MDTALFESLLYQNESETLDFKRDDYQLASAPPGKKAALLIDMLALANSWRSATAYLVLGVADEKSAPREVLGIPGSILARNLQQLVNGKTSRPLQFSYEEMLYAEKTIGIITIPVQQRPIYLRDDYAHARSNVVYVRRGDTNAVASPDEAVKMAQAPVAPLAQPQLLLNLADIKKHEEIGREASIACREIILTPKTNIPGYSSADRYGLSLNAMENADYYRDSFKYAFDLGFFHSVGFSVTNPSGQVAHNVILRMRISDKDIRVRAKGQIADVPSKTWQPKVSALNFSERNGIEVDEHGIDFRIVIRIGTVQPGITEYSREPIYFGSHATKDLKLQISTAADNLTSPFSEHFVLHFENTKVEVNIKSLLQNFR